jgi:hypothetical protein
MLVSERGDEDYVLTIRQQPERGRVAIGKEKGMNLFSEMNGEVDELC